MHFYEVGVEKKAVKNQRLLTYHFEESLNPGTIVRVPIGKNETNGLIFHQVEKPKFATKSISEVILHDAIPLELIKTAEWIGDYYATDVPSLMTMLLPRGAHKNRRQLTGSKVNPHAKVKDLTADQKRAMKQLKAAGKIKTSLLHGVTGSGKTKIYIELAKEAVTQGQSALILVPEIGLTSQIVNDFAAEINDVFIVHSHLGESQRHQTWLAISKAKNPVVIGARSALFAPIHNLGLIVVDEEHETAYKQDKAPRYHAVRVASYLSAQHKAQLVLGSATPSVETYHLALERGAPVVRMDKPVNELAAAEIAVIDLKDKAAMGNSSKILSKPLVESIHEALSEEKQVLLFHNRRGTATSVVCGNCGWLAECPNCILPLTHHGDSHELICHVCNYRMNSPISCPDCKKPELVYKGFGTKQIVSEVKRLFPRAKIARFDSDISAKEQLEKRYDELRAGEVDIIVGTQMIAKGLDLPKLNVVGVVLADTSLYLPDYSANERTFQLLQQVSGRVGRHSPNSKVFIQTYTPSHPAIQAAAARDYHSFYDNEIKQRQLTKYPPFRFLLSLQVERTKQSTAIKAAEDLAGVLAKNIAGIEILGPTPAFRERTPNGHRWQLVIKSKDRAKLVKIVRDHLPDRWQFDLDPVNLL